MSPENGLNTTSFISAWHLKHQQHFKFGLSSLDELMPKGVPAGSLALIQGNIPHKLLRSLVTHLVVGLLTTHPAFDIAFVDGANLFPYYEIAEECRRRGKNPLNLLGKISLARAFNFHQMTEILINNIPQLLDENPRVCIILVPQISSHYFSKEAIQYLQYDNLTIGESSLLELNQAMGKLKSLILKNGLLGIMTASSAPFSHQKPLGGTYLTHSACPIIRVAAVRSSVRKDHSLVFTLQKDPTRGMVQIDQSIEVKKNKNRQSVLTRFW
ncbi:MAG: hypothetical protein ACFFBD_29330 [Candidatus Hodarchaeota archaeon]